MTELRRRAPRFEPTWRTAGVVALAILILWCFAATRSTLFDRDEPRFATAAVEMVTSGNYLFPTYNHELRPDKPILIYWLMSIGIQLFGHSELAVRLWSAIGMAGSSLLTFYCGKRLFNARAGLYAMIAVALTPMTLIFGAWATADGVLLLCITGAMAAFVRMVTRAGDKIHWSDTLLIGLAIGFAQLEKGPVGLAIPVLSMIMALQLMHHYRDPLPKAGRVVLGASIISIVMFLVWAIPANNATQGEFLKQGIGHHVIDRFLHPQEGHGGAGVIGYLATLPVYVPVLIATFFPWTLYIFGAGSALAGRRIGDARARAILIGWIVPTLILMTLVATKLPHYIMPVWPGLALLVAATLDRFQDDKLDARDEFMLHRGGILFFPIAVIAILGLLVGPWFLPAPALLVPASALGIIFAIVTYLALREHLHHHYDRSAVVIAVGMVIIHLVAVGLVMPGVEAIKITPRLALAINEMSASDVPVTACDFEEPSLFFYLNRPKLKFDSIEETQVADWSRNPGAGVLVIPRTTLTHVQSTTPGLRLAEIASVTGVNYNKGLKQVEIVALVRNVPTTQTEPTTQPQPATAPATQP